MSIKAKALGKNIVYIDKHLHEFIIGTYTRYFRKTTTCGDLALLMAQLRKQEVIYPEKLEIMAIEVGINPDLAEQVYIPIMENLGFIKPYRDNTGKILKIEENIPPQEDTILELIGKLWIEESNEIKSASLTREPNEIEKSTVFSLELCSKLPMYESELLNDLENLDIKSESIIRSALTFSKDLGILSFYTDPEKKEALIASEYVFGENAIKIRKAIDHLSQRSKQLVLEVYDLVSKEQGLPEKSIPLYNLQPSLLKKFQKVGLLEPVSIETAKKEKERFLFTPRMWATTKKSILDVSDEVKLYLASIKFGQYFAEHARIRSPVLLTEALLRDGEVGPATPIGTDYILLEKRGIVKIRRSESYPDRFYMVLKKRNVVEVALDILRHGHVSPLKEITNNIDGITQPIHGYSPEQERIQFRKEIKTPSQIEQEIINILRREI
ncbi:MAG: hypothetical protein ACP6IQ_08115 [Candidatus Njordarchaeia archaeon]